MKISTYLTFNGNCREAMIFYRDCLGGDLVFQTIGESPMAEKIPPQLKKYILNATLINDSMVLTGTDMVGDQGLVKGNTVSLMLECADEEEIRKCYSRLSSGGRAHQPLERNYWGNLFGNLTDKFGNHWLLNCELHPILKPDKNFIDEF